MSQYKVITASTVIKPSAGFVTGFFTSSKSATPAVAIYDSSVVTTSDSLKVIDDVDPVVGTTQLNAIDGKIYCQNGIYVEITGTATLTIFFE